jgi:hypothetical protein
VQGSVLIKTMYASAPSSALSKTGLRPAVDKPTQHLDGMSCGVGPSPASELALPNSSEGPECVPSSHSLSALSVAPVEFHAQHFAKSSEQSGGRARDVWMWFWPVESKESRMPLKHDEPILFQCPNASAVACRLCWADEDWKAYKICDGVVTTLRSHLRSHHETVYEGFLQTGSWEMALRKHKAAHTDEPFHLAGFLERLLRWMVADGQVSSIFIFILPLCVLSDTGIVYQCCRQSRVPRVDHISRQHCWS